MGFLAATPFLVKSLSGPFGGITADLLRRKGLSTRSVRRLYFAVGTYIIDSKSLTSMANNHEYLNITVRMRTTISHEQCRSLGELLHTKRQNTTP